MSYLCEVLIDAFLQNKIAKKCAYECTLACRMCDVLCVVVTNNNWYSSTYDTLPRHAVVHAKRKLYAQCTSTNSQLPS